MSGEHRFRLNSHSWHRLRLEHSLSEVNQPLLDTQGEGERVETGRVPSRLGVSQQQSAPVRNLAEEGWVGRASVRKMLNTIRSTPTISQQYGVLTQPEMPSGAIVPNPPPPHLRPKYDSYSASGSMMSSDMAVSNGPGSRRRQARTKDKSRDRPGLGWSARGLPATNRPL